jgi:predicted helicase
MTKANIFHARVDEFWRRGQKFAYLEEKGHVGNIAWQELQSDAKHNWLTEGIRDEFEGFVPVGNKQSKVAISSNAIFKTYSSGVMSGRDAVVYSFDADQLSRRIAQFCDDYNAEVGRYQQRGKPKNLDDFLKNDRIKWSRNLKRDLVNLKFNHFDLSNLREACYRPFTKKYLYLGEMIVDELGKNKQFFPSLSKDENSAVCISGIGFRSPFSVLVVNSPADWHLCASSDSFQCFPFYIYNEDGTNRRENITDWALEKFRTHYGDESISKWDIFHYVYAVLHHPLYRERYAANLKRELPRVPYAPDFRAFASAGARLAELHVNYERQPEYALARTEQTNVALDYRVERMKLDKEAGTLRYNDFITLSGIPPETFDYRLGNRSALEWVVDQYQVSTDRRSGITNDPNRPDDPEYILRLVGQVVTVSLETGKLVRSLPSLGV